MDKTAKTVETVTIPKAEYETLLTEYDSLKQQVAWLMEKLRLSNHRQFGASGEKNVYGQMNFFNEAEVTAAPAADEPAIEEV